MDEIVIRIDTYGSLGCLYQDDLDLTQLGHLTVRRASRVEFDNAQQGWTIELMSGLKFSNVFPTRQAALDAEVKYLNRRIQDGTIERCLHGQT